MRGIPQWRGATPDTAIPPRVKRRVFDWAGGRCALCTRALTIRDGKCIDHIVALCNGGENSEGNLQLLCEPCHRTKSAVDVAEKAKVYALNMKHLGFHPASKRPMPHGKKSPTKRKMDGRVERR